MKYNNLLFIILLLISSCSKRNNGDNIDLNDKGKLFFSQIVDSITYIQLETNEQCLLGEISDLHFQNNIYYVYDRQTNSIYLFNEKGSFLNKISKYGRGPGEYVNLNSFFIDRDDNIHINDLTFKKVFVYDNKGAFLNEFWLDDYVRDFCVINNEYFLYMPDYNIDSKQGLYLYNKEDNQYEELLKIEGKNKFSVQWFITSLGENDNFSVVNNLNNDVHYFNQNGVFETREFHFSPLAHEMDENENAYSLAFYNESGNFMMWTFASIIPGNGVKIYLYNKKKVRGKVYDSINNDIDNRELGIPTRFSNNNRFIFWSNNNDEESNPILQILHLKQS